MLVIFSGSSGAGKNTLIQELMRRHPEIKTMKSATTRPQRNKLDNSHYFLTLEEFNRKLENGDFFEHEEVHKDLHYGILNEDLKIACEQGLYMADIDVNGAMKLKKQKSGSVKLIYLDVPKKELFKRLLTRGESEESAKLRLGRYDYEKNFIKGYDLVIKNKSVEDSVKIVEKFLNLKSS